ncbi:ABC transporter permease subunit [Nitratireductor aquimarinus]|nr:ABC transporter permease subunit [Nitratireductor aquibiodomus]MBN7776269.1 ABC transporter permease subunit [Nitratireductor pacificus]MBN7779136.1 ABC transporter permease subunit [Nitratireductor pacificus]MBN7787943.1 ABC transporter permease subunit [Nitratireductor aquimarinus]MBY6097990.1 ABC transporter permease subunit [Nitratireductor aquimarinus]
MPASINPAHQGGRLAAPSLPASRQLLARMLRDDGTGLKKAHYTQTWLAGLLLSPQLLILLFFFFIPSFKALSLAFVQVDPFGGREIFVGLQNFVDLFSDPSYRKSAWLTLWFTIVQNIATLGIAGVLAFATDQIIRGQVGYRSVLLLPYAIAPVISGGIWAYLFNPAIGPAASALHAMGVPWDPNLRPSDALILITISAVWKHICYDYIFLAAAMLAVPQSLREAAAIDGAGPLERFRTISLPLIAPVVMYLFIINMVYGLFDTFSIIDAVTAGGPAGSTSTLVYKVYQDGFIMMNLGSSAAQSIVLMVLAVLFTVLQFRAMDRKVNYQV